MSIRSASRVGGTDRGRSWRRLLALHNGFRSRTGFKEFLRDPLSYQLRARERYGDVFRSRIGSPLAHFLYHPDHVRRVLYDQQKNYPRGWHYRLLRRLLGHIAKSSQPVALPSLPVFDLPIDNMSAPRSRSRLSIRLRTLLAVMLASGCVLGLVGREVRQAKRREQAAQDLAKAASKIDIEYVNFWGGKVETPPPQWQRRILGEHFFQHVTGVIVVSADQLDPDGRELAELRHLRSLIYSAYRREDSERQLAGLRPLRRLEKVHLHGVTDAGLASLFPENPLLELNLGGSCVTDAGLAHVARFKTLESLDLSSTLITDKGIAHLLKLPRLKSLSMRRVQVSEEGLRRLAGRPSLESLDLGWLPMSAATLGEISRFPHLRRLSLGSGNTVSIFDAESLQDSASQERAAAMLEPPNVFWAIHRDHARNTPYLRWLLERGADPNNPPGGQRPLAILAGRGHREPIEVLLEFGADLNPARTDETPLAAAIGRGHLDLARFLLERGARPECDEQLTPLLAASYGRNDEAMRLLIAHGADVNRADAYGRRPLHVAAFNSRLLQLLLDAGADPNALDSEGNTPLHRAAEGGALESVRLLLARGSDPSLRNKQGDTPQAIAATLLERRGYSSQELVDTLAPAGRTDETPSPSE